MAIFDRKVQFGLFSIEFQARNRIFSSLTSKTSEGLVIVIYQCFEDALKAFKGLLKSGLKDQHQFVPDNVIGNLKHISVSKSPLASSWQPDA